MPDATPRKQTGRRIRHSQSALRHSRKKEVVSVHRGKANGFAKTVTEDLQNLLEKNSSYTSRWSGTADRKARSLSSSQAMVWRNDGCVNSIISLRHLNRRLRLRKQGQALGFCKASKRIDTCRTCHTWDTTQAREIARSVTELKEMLLGLFPDYFAAFNAGTLFMWSTAVDMGVESVLYLESLADFISQHKQVQKFSRRHLDEEKKLRWRLPKPRRWQN